MVPKPLISLDFRHKKRRPWTSLDEEVVGRGKLNAIVKLLNLLGKFILWVCVEYLLEYQRFPQVFDIFGDISANCLDNAEARPSSQR